MIGLAPARRVLPDEAGTVAHHCNRGRGVISLIASQDWSFAPAQRGDQSGGINRCHIGIAGFYKRLSGDIARHAISERGDDTHLLAGTELLDNRVLGKDFDFGDARRFEIKRGATGNPLTKDAIILAVQRCAAAALVRDLRHGFQQHQAVVRGGEVHAA